MALCTIKYVPTRATPEHLQGGLRLKGEFYRAGVAYQVPAERAGLLLKSAFEGTLKVLDGEPVTAPVISSAAKAARQQLETRARVFPVDPMRALDGIEPFDKAELKAMQGKDAAKAIEAGDLDDRLGEAAVWARLSGLEQITVACVRRADALRKS